MQDLIGHTSEIGDLSVHPGRPDLLLSSSQDASVMLWSLAAKYPVGCYGCS